MHGQAEQCTVRLSIVKDQGTVLSPEQIEHSLVLLETGIFAFSAFETSIRVQGKAWQGQSRLWKMLKKIYILFIVQARNKRYVLFIIQAHNKKYVLFIIQARVPSVKL